MDTITCPRNPCETPGLQMPPMPRGEQRMCRRSGCLCGEPAGSEERAMLGEGHSELREGGALVFDNRFQFKLPVVTLADEADVSAGKAYFS